jgi:UDP-2,3-diacylglucosamine pyrophosphatase LpxH/biotin operon repressor
MGTINWTKQMVDGICMPIIRQHPLGARDEARVKIARALGAKHLTDAQLRGVYARYELGNPWAFLGLDLRDGSGKRHTVADVPPVVADDEDDGIEVDVDLEADEPAIRPDRLPQDLQSLLEATKKGPVSLTDLCDKLDLSPKRLKKLVDRAKVAGLDIDTAHDHVAFRPPEPTGRVQDTGIHPTTGKRQIVGVISDTHLGSKYCLRPQLQDFIGSAYERGAREILHVGDAIDGKYRHGMFELTHSGIEDQTRDLFETLPRLEGLTYHAISGNHCDTFADEVGMAPGDYMQWYFQKHGRTDLKFYGRRGAYLKVRGAVVELWHPRKSGAYSLSYHLQNHIRDYGVGQKPDVLLAGHWHTFCYLEQRGVHALACGTFQGGGSAFAKSLGGATSIGGTLLSWELTEKRTLRAFAVERFSYYEREELRPLELA